MASSCRTVLGGAFFTALTSSVVAEALREDKGEWHDAWSAEAQGELCDALLDSQLGTGQSAPGRHPTAVKLSFVEMISLSGQSSSCKSSRTLPPEAVSKTSASRADQRLDASSIA